MVNMKTLLTFFLIIAVAFSALFGFYYFSVNAELKTTKTELNTVQTDLDLAKSELSVAKKDAEVVKNELTGTQAELKNMQSTLKATESELVQSENSLISTKAQLTETKQEVSTVIGQLEISQQENMRFLNGYTALMSEIFARLGFKEDREKFITPDSPLIITKASAIAGPFSNDNHERWQDYLRLYQWVFDNIEYSSDTGLPILPATPDGSLRWLSEFFKTPEETLEDGNGDCEDMANLLASLLLSYVDQQYAVWVIEIRPPTGSGHVAVALPVTGDELTILDPAGMYFTGYSTGYLSSDDIATAIHDWLAHWAIDMPGAEVTAVYSSDFYQEFTGADDFIDWAINRY
jgi:hypothetical protein